MVPDIVRPNMDYETVVRKMAPAVAKPFSWLNCDLDLDEIDGKLDWLHKMLPLQHLNNLNLQL